MSRISTGFVSLGIAAMVLTSAAMGAAAQGGDSNSAIGELLTQVMPDVGLQRYLPDQAEAPNQSAVDSARAFDNFDLTDAALDASGIMPLRISTGVIAPSHNIDVVDVYDEALNAVGPDFRLAAPMDANQSAGFYATYSPEAAEALLREAGWLDDGPSIDFGAPPDPFDMQGGQDLTPTGQEELRAVIDQAWPGEPLTFPPFIRRAIVGPDSPLGCGPHDGYDVLCDPSDPGGSQFGSELRFVGVQLPEPLDTMGDPYELEVVLRLLGVNPDVYRGSFDGDLFNEANHILAVREGGTPQFERLDYLNQQWGPGSNASRAVVSDDAVIFLLEDSLPVDGFGIATFMSTGVRAAGNVASFAIPPTTERLFPFDPPVVAPPDFPPSTFAITPDRLLPGSPELDTWFVAADPEPAEAEEPTPVVEVENDNTQSDEDSAVDQADDVQETAAPGPAADSSGDSNARDIILVVVGGAAVAAGGYGLATRKKLGAAGAGGPSAVVDDDYLVVGDPEADARPGAYVPNNSDVDAVDGDDRPIFLDHPADATEVDDEDRPETPTVTLPPESPYPRAQGPGSWFRNNRALQLWRETGQWFDPMAIPLPRLLQNAIDSRPEPPKVITPAMAEARQGMFAGAQTAGLQLPGKAMLTHSYDSYRGLPHMFWTVRVGPDGSILDSYANAEPGGPAASAILRIEVYPDNDGNWWSAVRLVDTTKATVYVANSPTSADPDGPWPSPDTAEEAIRMALTGLVTPDGRIAQPRDPRLER